MVGWLEATPLDLNAALKVEPARWGRVFRSDGYSAGAGCAPEPGLKAGLKQKKRCRVSRLFSTCMDVQHQERMPMLCQPFLEEIVTRISHAVRRISQVVRDTLR